MTDTTRTLRPAHVIARKRLFARSYVVRLVTTTAGGFRNLYDLTDGTDTHIASLQVGADGSPGGISVYREAVPSALISWLIGLPAS
jgi:hypothetical protein